MNAAVELLVQGGVVMAPLLVLSLVLYQRCVRLLLDLRRVRYWLRRGTHGLTQRWQLELVRSEFRELYRRHRQWIRLLVAAAPLLGLLGTVMGMIRTFESLAGHASQDSITGLARGISMALITTETGLAIAIPAVLMTYYAQRQMQKGLQDFIHLERRLPAPMAS